MLKVRFILIGVLTIAAGAGISSASGAAGYNPVAQQAQSKLATLGLYRGTLDGVAGSDTITAIKAFQKQSGLPETGTLDSATLAKLGIGTSVDKVNAVADWIQVPTQEQLDKLAANPANDPSFPFTDYRPGAPAANLDLPGAAVLAAMNSSADIFGSRLAGQPKHTDQGYKYLSGCLALPKPLARYCHPLLLPDVKTEGVLYLCAGWKINTARRKIFETGGLSRLCDREAIPIW